jgi:NAD(P)-dependent dehydrogenase (short-subunit alcohol dehydrogenase family)
MAKNVVITGANRGLGLELVRCYQAAGALVHAGCRRPAAAMELSELAPASIAALDVTEPASVVAFGAAVAAECGSIDLLINNAGLNATAFGADRELVGPFDIDPEHFMGEIRANAVGPMLVTRALLEPLRANGGAIVLNVSSQLGAMSFGARAGNDIGYNASKAALNMVSVRSADLLTDDGVAVVAMHPGWLRTDMGGAQAALDPAETAEAILATVGRLGPEDSGTFIRWDGTVHEW